MVGFLALKMGAREMFLIETMIEFDEVRNLVGISGPRAV